MKLIITVFILALALPLYAQKPTIKFYLNGVNQPKEYKIDDINQINFIKSNPNTSMLIYQKGTTYSYMITNLISIEFVDSTQLNINLSSSLENINITQIDSIIFISNTCSEIAIGTQTWMCRNLDVDHYRNGDSIPQVTNASEWANLTSGAWCYYNNDPALGAVYGKLYNWYAVNDSRGLAPDGWHVASNEEWKILSTYLGGDPEASGRLKEAGTRHWPSPNASATNESGFTALPGGFRVDTGSFSFIGSIGHWWSSKPHNASNALSLALFADDSGPNLFVGPKGSGFSVRCVKD
ncbi:MAG: fibrobacter succinogenes major paralogous domain-containing protein [bacterium]